MSSMNPIKKKGVIASAREGPAVSIYYKARVVLFMAKSSKKSLKIPKGKKGQKTKWPKEKRTKGQITIYKTYT
jgi:hypothetical protein